MIRRVTFRVLPALALLTVAGCRDEAQTALARGNILRNQGHAEAALAAYREAAVRAPARAEIQLALGDLLVELSRPAEALAAYRAAAAAAPRDPAPHLAAARVLSAQGDLASARAELSEALGRMRAGDGRARPARLSRGHLALKAGDAAAAVADFTDAAHEDGADPVVLYSLLRGLLAARDLSGAEATAARLAQVAPASPLAAYGAALVASARGDRAAALAALRRAVARDPAEGRAVLADPALGSLRDDPEARRIVEGTP